MKVVSSGFELRCVEFIFLCHSFMRPDFRIDLVNPAEHLRAVPWVRKRDLIAHTTVWKKDPSAGNCWYTWAVFWAELTAARVEGAEKRRVLHFLMQSRRSTCLWNFSRKEKPLHCKSGLLICFAPDFTELIFNFLLFWRIRMLLLRRGLHSWLNFTLFQDLLTGLLIRMV